jgi:bacteriocin-like protein
MTTEIHELSINELDTVSGGDMLGVAIDAAEKYANGLFGRLIAAVHQPVTSQPTK